MEGRRMYLLRVSRGKEALVTLLMKKYGLEVERIAERGFLLCEERPPQGILDRFKKYLYGVLEISEQEVKGFISLKDKGCGCSGLKPGSFVEVTSGVYQSFNGILRGFRGERAVVDINIFGKVLTIEVFCNQINPISIPEPWR